MLKFHLEGKSVRRFPVDSAVNVLSIFPYQILEALYVHYRSAKKMQLAHRLISGAYFVGSVVLLTACGSGSSVRWVSPTLAMTELDMGDRTSSSIQAAQKRVEKPADSAGRARTKTEAEPGEFVGPITDCDGDGIANDSGIDFDGDGVSDECVDGREEVPEPPFQQTYTPTSETFYSLLPAVGWSAQYQCDDGLYQVSLGRPTEGSLEYNVEGLKLITDVVYDDLDPNLNHPLVIKEPIDGLRYSFQQESGGEFYEYAITNYGGSIGLYVYQTGEQVVAVPCEVVK